MKWKNRPKSRNVEDRRGQRTPRGSYRRGGRGMMPIGGGFGLFILIIIFLLFGRGNLFGGTPVEQDNNVPYETTYEATATEEEIADFVKVVLKDTEDVWHEIFDEYGYVYDEPVLVLYTDYVESACGFGQAAQGPFYCSADQQVYIDLSFFQDLKTRFGAPGDFAIAYVLAHEIGHHVQNELGIMEQYQSLIRRLNDTERNQLSVRLELQADYLAGVWAKRVEDKGYLEVGDIEEAINAAQAVGDDRIQKQIQGYITPDSFTHGSSKQRMEWFMRGYEAGDLSDWDTFNTGEI